MSVDRLTSGRFERSETQARNTAKAQLEIILANKDALVSARGGEKKLRDARDLAAKVLHGEQLSSAQYSYIDGIYEATMKALGFDSVSTHRDRKFSLRNPA